MGLLIVISVEKALMENVSHFICSRFDATCTSKPTNDPVPWIMLSKYLKVKFSYSADKEALVSILTKPKNSIISQYKYLLSLDDCELIFTDESLEAIAECVIKRRSG